MLDPNLYMSPAVRAYKNARMLLRQWDLQEGVGLVFPPPAGGLIWSDDFDQDRLGTYFEYNNPPTNKFVRVTGVGTSGSVGMRAQYTPGTSNTGDIKLAFGRTPDAYVRPVDSGITDYRELYARVYFRTQPGWTGGGGDKFMRISSLVTSNWAQPFIAHLWSGGPGPNQDYLVLDPARGTDVAGNLLTTTYNDFPNLTFLGMVRGNTPVFSAANAGKWWCIEVRVKLNTPGQSDGIFTLFVNGVIDAQATGLNWLGSYQAYGINVCFLENYWNATAPVAEERYFDHFAVSTQPLGIVVDAATQVAITTQPSGATDGQIFTTQPVVEIRNVLGDLINSSTQAVTVSKVSGGGTLTGTLTKNAVAGVATFNDLKITGTGPHVLRFTATGLTTADSASFTVQSSSSLFPLTITPDNHWVQRPSGPKYNAAIDTNWSLFAELTQAEATAYFADRAAKGINGVIASLIEHKFTANTPAPRNANGDLPFTGTVGGEEDFTTPNTAYWNHVDWIINKAAEFGIVIWAAPCYLGFQHGDEGWTVEMLANGTARMTTYGTFLGNRYLNFPNIIWVMGGDWGPVFGGSNVTTHINNLANAIKAVDTVHLMTAHPAPGNSSLDDYNQSWLQLNLAYSGVETTCHQKVRLARQQVPAKPTLNIEPRYGNEPPPTAISALNLRAELWQSTLGGGFGFAYGNAPQWYDGVNASHPANSFAAVGGLNYAANFDSFEADKLSIIVGLQAARDLSSLTPDYTHTKVTAGYDPGGVEGITYAPVTASNQILVAYVRGGSGQPLTVARNQFATGTFNVKWYNARTGSITSGGTSTFGAGQSNQVFTAPDANDWILLLDLASLNLPDPTPGTNQPAGFSMLTQRSFLAKVENGWLDTGASDFTIQTGQGGPEGDDHVGQAFYPNGFASGDAPIKTYFPTNANKTKFFVRIKGFRISPNWYGNDGAGVNKIVFIWHGTGPTLFLNMQGQGNGQLFFRANTQLPSSAQGDYSLGQSRLECLRGVYYDLEVLFEENSAGGVADGRIRMWGRQSGTSLWTLITDSNVDMPGLGFPGLVFYDAGGAHFFNGEPSWNPTYGGGGNPVPAGQYQQMDYIYFSTN